MKLEWTSREKIDGVDSIFNLLPLMMGCYYELMDRLTSNYRAFVDKVIQKVQHLHFYQPFSNLEHQLGGCFIGNYLSGFYKASKAQS